MLAQKRGSVADRDNYEQSGKGKAMNTCFQPSILHAKHWWQQSFWRYPQFLVGESISSGEVSVSEQVTLRRHVSSKESGQVGCKLAGTLNMGADGILCGIHRLRCWF